MMRPLDNLLQRLQEVRQKGGGYVARCPNPGHGKGRGDLNPSLSVAEGDDGRVLVKCWAACSIEEVIGPIGLDKRDLFERNGSGEGVPPPPSDGAVNASTVVGITRHPRELRRLRPAPSRVSQGGRRIVGDQLRR